MNIIQRPSANKDLRGACGGKFATAGQGGVFRAPNCAHAWIGTCVDFAALERGRRYGGDTKLEGVWRELDGEGRVIGVIVP